MGVARDMSYIRTALVSPLVPMWSRKRTGRAARSMPNPFFPESPFPDSAADQMPRLLLEPTMSRSGLFDGAWWPHSHDIRAELPDLLTALSAHLGRVVRVALDTAAWDEVPRAVTVDGFEVRIGWLATAAGTICVSRGMQDHFLYLVIPPGLSESSAAIAMAGAAETGNHTPATELLGRRTR